MPRTRLNPCLAKLNRAYTIEATARLYGVSRTTVRAWLKSGQLHAIDDRRPCLIKGKALRTFLGERRAKAKRPCPPGTIYCFRCREPRAPVPGMVSLEEREGGAGNLRAICGDCGTIMHRRARRAALPSILPGIEVRIMQAPQRLAERTTPSLKRTLEKA